MHPVLFYWKVPPEFLKYFGPKSALFASWMALAVVAGAGFLVWLWATEPKRKTPRTLAVWLSSLVVLAAGLPLLGIALARAGEVKLHSYGVMMSMSFIVGILLAVREARRVGENPEKILDLTFWILISSMIGARVLYIVTTWEEYSGNLGKLLRFWEGGLVYYGGFIGATLYSWWFMKRHKMNFWKVADTLVPYVVLGQVFGRIGCYTAGCCYGKAAYAGMDWAVTFPTGPASLLGAVHPAQLYEATANLLVFFLLLIIRSRKSFHGAVLVGYLVCYSLLRFGVEIFRGDTVRKFAFTMDLTPKIPGPEILSTSQTVGLGLLVLAFGIYKWQKNKANAA